MQVGKPSITQTSIRAALAALAYTTTDTQDAVALQQLALTDNRVRSVSAPDTPELRRIAVSNILTTIVEMNIKHYRQLFDLAEPQHNDPVDVVTRQIRLDSQIHSPELMAWSLLYYRYVRFEFNFTTETFSQLINVDVRTIRRYLRHGIQRLTERVVEDEWQMRQQNRQRYLMGKIPQQLHVDLFGRQTEQNHLMTLLHSDPAAKIEIAGVSGIGKTALVQTVVDNLISANQIDHLIWVRHPNYISDIYQEIISELEAQDIDAAWLRISQFRTVVVVDDISNLDVRHHDWAQLFEYLSKSVVFVISRHNQLSVHYTTSVRLEELAFEDMANLLKQRVLGISQERTNEIFEQVGGHPTAALLMVSHPVQIRKSKHHHRILRNLYERLYHEISTEGREAWHILAVLYHYSVNAQDMKQFLSSGVVTEDGIQQLSDILVLQPTASHNYGLGVSAGQFIESQYRHDPSVNDAINIMLHQKILPLVTQNSQLLTLVEGLLLSNWLQMSSQPASDLLQAGWQFATSDLVDRSDTWWQIFKRHLVGDQPHDIRLLLGYGQCGRAVHLWDQSRSILQQAVIEAGEQGLFDLQSKALYELALLSRMAGSYEAALQILGRIRSTADDALRENIQLELAQIALDRASPNTTLQHLSQLQETTSVRIIRSEAFLMLDEYSRSQDLAFQCLRETPTQRQQITIYNVIGRNYHALGKFDKAIDWLNASLALVERSQDLLATARLQSNLAAILIEQGSFEEAIIWLETARLTQKYIEDTIGLDATVHNLRWLERLQQR